MARSVGPDEPQDSTGHEPKRSTLFESVEPCVAGAPGKERASESSLSPGYHHECGEFSTEDRASETSLSQSFHHKCDQDSAKSADRGAVNSDGVRIHMTAEVETEWLDDVGVSEWLDDAGVVSHSVQMDVFDSHCTPPHPLADAAWCMSSASQQDSLDAESKDGSVTEFTDCVCGSGLRSARTRAVFMVTVICSTLSDCIMLTLV